MNVIQLETAVGAAIKSFDRAVGEFNCDLVFSLSYLFPGLLDFVFWLQNLACS